MWPLVVIRITNIRRRLLREAKELTRILLLLTVVLALAEAQVVLEVVAAEVVLVAVLVNLRS